MSALIKKSDFWRGIFRVCLEPTLGVIVILLSSQILRAGSKQKSRLPETAGSVIGLIQLFKFPPQKSNHGWKSNHYFKSAKKIVVSKWIIGLVQLMLCASSEWRWTQGTIGH